MVHEKAGRNVTEPNTVYNIIRDQFKARESKLEQFIGNPARLDTPITKCKVAQSIHKLRNNRAPEYDQITPEILKYAPTESHDLIAESFNNIFPKHEYINVGHGLLTALQKGRSTSNILWCHRFLAARIQNVQEGIMVTGIEMILPFDTTERTKLIEIVESFLREDEMRIIRILFSNTTLDIKSSSNISNSFDANAGSPQGDDLSGRFSIIYLEKALCDQVDNDHVTGEQYYAINSKGSPADKCIYADNTNLISNCTEKKKLQLMLVTPTSAEFNLQINDTKTEHTVLKKSEKLGSLMCDQEDILRRKQLSTTALHNLKNNWTKKNRIREHVQLKHYKTIAKPVLMYNSQTWDLTVNDEP